MGRNVYQFYCTFCNFKKLSDGTDTSVFKEIPRADILTGPVPQKKFSGKKTNEPTEEYLKKTIKQIKQFKCPQCGFAIRAKKISLTEKPLDEQTD